MDIFEEGLEPVKEPTYQDVLDSLDMVLQNAPKWAVKEEIENLAEYILTIEKLLEEHDIEITDEDMKRVQFDNEVELKESKKRLLMHFVGKIIRREG